MQCDTCVFVYVCVCAFCSCATCKYDSGWLNRVEHVHFHGILNLHNNHIRIEIATCTKLRGREKKRRQNREDKNRATCEKMWQNLSPIVF